jgi:hypothetical protein
MAKRDRSDLPRREFLRRSERDGERELAIWKTGATL